MGISISNFVGGNANPNIEIKQHMNGMAVLEYKKDLSVTPMSAVSAFYQFLKKTPI